MECILKLINDNFESDWKYKWIMSVYKNRYIVSWTDIFTDLDEKAIWKKSVSECCLVDI